MIKQLLLLSIAIANLTAAYCKRPESIDKEIKLKCTEILRLQQINTRTAKALLRLKMRQLREILNEVEKKNE